MKLLVYSVSKDIMPLLESLKNHKDLFFIEGYFDEILKPELMSLGTVKGKLSDVIEEVNFCWIPDLKETRNERKGIVENVSKYIPNHVPIVFSLELSESEKNKLKNKSISEVEQECLLENLLIERRVLPLDKPVVAFGKIVEGLSISSDIFSLYQNLTKIGYRVSFLTNDRNYGYWFGKMLPKIEVKDIDNLKDHVFLLNLWLNEQIESGSTDIILLELPSPILPFSNKIDFGFGLIPYVYSHAIQRLDYFTLFLTAEYIFPEFIEEMGQVLKYRFSQPLNNIAVKSCTVDESDFDELNYLKFVQVEQQDINMLIREYEELVPLSTQKILSTDKKGFGEKSSEDIINYLSEMSEYH